MRSSLSSELEFVKLNPIAVLLILQNHYSHSCIAIGFRRCYVLCERKRSNSLNLYPSKSYRFTIDYLLDFRSIGFNCEFQLSQGSIAY
jgi:hypothetical protein